MTFASHVKTFNKNLALHTALPENVGVMNPFAGEGSAQVLKWSGAFYDQYYADNNKRWFIIGINPGRFGGGITGVPFTDLKKLKEECGIDTGMSSHEPSSEFVYKMIHSIGSVAEFYAHFYINSMSPLGYIIKKDTGKWVNYNYYDDKQLYAAVRPFIISSIQKQTAFGLHTEECFCMGKENSRYLEALNNEYQFFDKITMLPHPRFVVQYKRKEMDKYIEEYRQKLAPRMKG